MNIIDQSFLDKKTGTIHKILNVNNGIALTDNIEKIPVNKLLDSNLYTHQGGEVVDINESIKSVDTPQTDIVDPNKFFNNQSTYNIFADKIKSVDTSKMKDDEPINVNLPNDLNVDNSINAAYTSSIDDEKAELARKYGVQNTSPQQSVQKQNEAFAKYLDDEGPVVKVNADTHQIEEPVNNVVVNNIPKTTPTPTTNPVHSVFDQAKKSLPFTAIINQSGYIPRLDFIELMEDSYEVSIIDYLANDYVNQLLANPEQVKNQIKSQIISLLEKSKPKKRATKPKTTKKVVKKTTPTKKEPVVKKTTPIKEESKEPLNEVKKTTKKTTQKEEGGEK